ncbi:hypothetical protein Acav_3380 [Paracidovorax avenae ATCC 19860]|uniref:Uncharacterized protein n=1 Tax=Paracidovorax avenae (strain ATCC 19860 / DSM 7227 / CCUG 15838 / JCM 20985 / LMG 2117 / NCPPB 1011) TaxID=643561 RepID=F0QA21_PARA1|nr:hypothetical protein Acav_3380 [Paracidovorax avenae ATCC 19860]
MAFRCCWAFVFRGRDVRPAAHLLSFASPKESRQRKGEPWCLRPPSPRRGEGGSLRCSEARRGCGTRCALARSARTTAASQITRQACPSARLRALPPALLGAATRAGCSIRAIASLGLGCASAAHRARILGSRAHVLLPSAAMAWRPSNAKARITPSGCAWGAQGVGWRACRRTRPHRELTCRGCPSGAHGVRAASSTAHPTPEHPRLPRSPCGRTGSQTAGSPFFWVLFFGEAKKSTSPAGARPGPRP